MKYWICQIFLILILLNYSCGKNPKENLKKFNSVKNDLASNYQNNNEIFLKLRNYFLLNHIKNIDLSKNQILLTYTTNNKNDEYNIAVLKNNFNDSVFCQVLKLDNLDSTDMNRIISNLSDIGVDKLSLIDNYDNKLGNIQKKSI